MEWDRIAKMIIAKKTHWEQKSRTPTNEYLTAQLTDRELTLKLTVSSISGHSVTSQWTHKITHTMCELGMSFPWVCNSLGELCVSYLWDHQMSSPSSGSSELTVRVANSRKAHRKLTVWAHVLSSLWADWVSCKWAQPWDNSGELSEYGVSSHLPWDRIE